MKAGTLVCVCVYIYIYRERERERTLENTDENKNFFVRSPQAFWQSSAPGVLSTLVTSVVLYSLTRATLMSPGQDEVEGSTILSTGSR